MITLRDEPTYASAGFRAGPLSWPKWNLEMLFFFVGKKTGESYKKAFGAR